MFKAGFLMLIFLLVSFTQKDNYRKVTNSCFGEGEHFEYRVHYGFLNAAEATVDVAPQIQMVNNRPCYKVMVVGKTVGAFDFMNKIRDTWHSWIDTTAIVAQKSYRNIQENNYRKEETVIYDQPNDQATVNVKGEAPETFKIPNYAQDAISAYFYLRVVDYNKIKVGDIVQVPAFFDRQIYQTRVKYRGREIVKTKFGKIKAIKLNPLMNSDNELFKGENSIRMWVSDDENRVPIRVEVDLWVGSMVMELRNYRGTKQDFKWL